MCWHGTVTVPSLSKARGPVQDIRALGAGVGVSAWPEPLHRPGALGGCSFTD